MLETTGSKFFLALLSCFLWLSRLFAGKCLQVGHKGLFYSVLRIICRMDVFK